MLRNLVFPATLAAFFAVNAVPALAQTAPMQWEVNQQSQINQDAASGLLNAGQVGRLNQKEAQIQAQQATWMQQNGGRLTGGEQRTIARELRGVSQHLN